MADGDLSRRPARDASAQAIIDALNQVNRNVAAAREGIRRVEEKQVRVGAEGVGAGAAPAVSSNPELERRIQLLREGRIEGQRVAKTEFDHLQAIKQQAEAARRLQQTQSSLVTGPAGYRAGGGRLSYFDEQAAAVQTRRAALERQLSLSPTPGNPANLIIVENEIAVRRRALEEIRRREEQIAAERLQAERIIDEQRAKQEAHAAVQGGGGVLYYGQPANSPGAGYNSFVRGRAYGPGTPDREAVSPTYRRDTFNSLDASRAIEQNPQRLRQFYGEMQQGAIIQANASQQMRRHGALTTEFLEALARGEVTLAEFRYQLGSTIGKFAGWTAAATSVYAVVGAVGTLGKGALDSLSGVNQLGRFVNDLDTSKAQEQFRSLAREFHLPIQTVVDGASRIAQVYHNQNDALEATRTVLQAVRVADLDVGDATDKLVPIVQGFKLDVGDLSNVLGAANQAQNDFGASIPDLLSGLAKAGGAVRAVGGDFLTATTFIATAKRVTGQSGDAIGTALRRSANLIRRPSNREVLQRYGIDPESDYNTILRESLRVGDKLQKEGLPGRRKLAELATKGLSTPQLGPIFTAVLQNKQLFDRIYADVQPGRAQIGLNRELSFVLSSVSDQFKAIRANAESLGASLAQAHFFDAFGGLLQTVKLVLSTTNDLLDVFNALPDPIKRSVAYLGEAYVALRLLRRTGAGQGLADRTGIAFLGRSPEERLRAQATSGQRNLAAGLANEQERVANQLAERSVTVYTGEARIAQLGQQRAALLATEGADQLRLQTIEQEINAETARVNAAREEGLRLAERQAVIEGRRLEIEATVRDLQKGRISVAGAAAVQGAPIVVPNGLGSQAGTTTVQPNEAELANTRGQLSSRAQRVRNTLDSLILTNAVASRNTVAVAEGGRGLGKSYQTFERAALTGSALTARSVQVAEGAIGSIRSAGAGIAAAGAGLLAALGPLDIALIGSVVGFEAIHSAQEEQRKHMQKMHAIFNDPKTAQDAEKIRQEAERLSRPQRGGLTGYYDSVVKTIDKVLPLPRSAGEQASRDQQKAEQRANELLQQRERILTTQRSGGTASGAYLAQVESQYKNDIKDIKDYGKLRAAINRRISEVVHSAEAGQNPNNPRLAATISRYRNFLASRVPEGANPFEEFDNATRDFLGKLMQRAQQRLEVRAGAGGSTRGPVRELAAGYITAVQRYSHGTLDDLKAVTEARDAFIKGISQSVDDQLQLSLKLARGPAEQQSAYSTATRRYRDAISALRTTRAAQRSGLGRAQEQLDAYEKELSDAQSYQTGIRLPANETRPGGANITALEDAVKQQRKVVKKLQKNLGDSSIAVRRAERELQGLLQDQETAAFEARNQSRQVQLAYQQSLTADKTEQNREAIAEAGKAVQDAIKTFGRNDDRTIEAITKQNELTQQAAQDAVDHVKVVGDLRTSRINTLGAAGDIGRARSDIQTIREEIRAAKKGKADPDKIKELQIELNNASRELAQTLKDHAQALAEARFDIAIAGILEPAERLRKQLQFDQSQLGKLTGLDRLKQLGKIKQDKSDLQQQKVNDDLEQLGFLHDVEKLSDDAYIAGLRKIINTRKISKSLKRQLLTEIHNLQKQDSADLELNVGDIKLPTVYDVRRLMKQGLNDKPVVHQTFSFQIDGSGDPASVANTVASKFETSSKGGIKSAMRAAGLR